jgi:hypothetical protein
VPRYRHKARDLFGSSVEIRSPLIRVMGKSHRWNCTDEEVGLISLDFIISTVVPSDLHRQTHTARCIRSGRISFVCGRSLSLNQFFYMCRYEAAAAFTTTCLIGPVNHSILSIWHIIRRSRGLCMKFPRND